MKFSSTLLIAISTIASINGLAINRRDPGHSHDAQPASQEEEAPSTEGGDLLSGLLGGVMGGMMGSGSDGGLLEGVLGGMTGSSSEDGEASSGGMLSSIPVAGGLLSGLGLGI